MIISPTDSLSMLGCNFKMEFLCLAALVKTVIQYLKVLINTKSFSIKALLDQNNYP